MSSDQNHRMVGYYMDASENNGTPKSPILIGVFHYKPSILGYHYFWKHPYRDNTTIEIVIVQIRAFEVIEGGPWESDTCRPGHFW